MQEDASIEQLVAKANELGAAELPPGTTCHRTYCDFHAGRLICDWEAPSQEAVEGFLRARELPWAAIAPVRIWDYAKAAFEP